MGRGWGGLGYAAAAWLFVMCALACRFVEARRLGRKHAVLLVFASRAAHKIVPHCSGMHPFLLTFHFLFIPMLLHQASRRSSPRRSSALQTRWPMPWHSAPHPSCAPCSTPRAVSVLTALLAPAVWDMVLNPDIHA